MAPIFEPVLEHETYINMTSLGVYARHQCITSMEAYMSKDMEELRFEDYLAGRKPKTATTGAFLADFT